MSANNNAINSTGIASETVFKIPSMRKLSETIDARKSRNESRERPRKMFTKQEIHDYKRKYNGLRDMLSSERSKSPELKVLISDALIFYKLVTGLSNAFLTSRNMSPFSGDGNI
uniref:BHLH domain-containing protein n=1 Tax=Caenorhabditis tropicalis TaxID=1561998 RepID=A0A1I7TLE1_9PELO